MPTPVWVTLVSLGPMVLLVLGLGLFLKLRPRFPPFARTAGLVVVGVDVAGVVSIQFDDKSGRRREVAVFYIGRPRNVGEVVPIVYNSRRPEEAMIDGPGRDGTFLFVLAGATGLLGVIVAIGATLTGPF